MRLKNLELQGYKTFASRTEFAFDGGITAIVGPNGSGKSNVADAIRWVLGEQSYRTLRAKRTEDMIFSGSSLRARQGMASASLIFDNADGWLPIDFAEVTVARRAYRSGENEYLLNGTRVRLRDITELLAKSGLAQRTYTVIGQGLVDAVLSLRAEDRRALFEEAAGISLYQSKRADTISRLEETRSNLVRINDIVNEIAPRLRRLEREAERAERYSLLSRQLEGLLRTWYGYRWRQEQRNLIRSRDALNRREVSLDRRRKDLDGLDQQVDVLRGRQAQLREQLGGWHHESSKLHRQMEEVQRDLAVWQERARLLARQCDELQTELAGLAAQAQAAAERVSDAEREIAEFQAGWREQEALVEQAQVDLDAHEAQRAAISEQVAEVQTRAFDLAAQATDRRNRLAQIDEQRAIGAREREEHQSAIAEQQARADEVQASMDKLATERRGLESEIESLEKEAARLDAVLTGTQARQSDLSVALADVQRALERLQSRYELLSRLRAEGEGLRSGVRAVLQAAQSRSAGESGEEQTSGALRGIVGTVAQLLYVPSEYEVAIEVALGEHLQNLVVESWADAEAAIGFLQRGQRGRATFLPLDTLRPASRLEIPEDAGLIGVAADLVQTNERLAGVVEMLLSRTAVAHDLKSACRAFGRLEGGFQIVTLSGEVLRSSGAITGGQGRDQVQGQVLAREREWRELPAEIEATEEHCTEIESELAQSRADEQRVRAQAAALGEQRKGLEQSTAALEAQQQDLRRDLDLAKQQIALRAEQLTHLDDQEAELATRQSALSVELERFEAEKAASEGQVAALQAQLDELRGETFYQRLSEAQTAAAVARRTWEHRRQAVDALREQHAQLQSQIESKGRRIAELEEEQRSLAEQIRAQGSREAVIQSWLASLAEKIDPAEAEVAELEREREQLEVEEVTLRAQLRQAESNYSQALLAQSRQADRLERLRQQIMDDFGLVDMELTEGLPEQPPLPLGELVSTLPVVEELPEGLEEEIHQLRAQMRRMGAVNPTAPEEYGEVLDRYTFLTTQATDLEEAARSLREVIAELDDVMRHEFHATFKAVAERFSQNFTQLFGGGTARLVLTDPDDVTITGVEIVARPPGKRQQTLALLSGGERSLTAVALIFSILEVSPPPFCILDEVDAMLDEANVKRFRQALEALSRQTQFIIITHNRGTIHAADTIYGVSMGEDSVSQVVSLRLEGDQIAAPDGSMVEVKEG